MQEQPDPLALLARLEQLDRLALREMPDHKAPSDSLAQRVARGLKASKAILALRVQPVRKVLRGPLGQ